MLSAADGQEATSAQAQWWGAGSLLSGVRRRLKKPEVGVLEEPEVGGVSWRRYSRGRGSRGASGEAESGSGQGVAASPVAEGSRRDRPGCGRSGAVCGPGGLERAPWRGRAGTGLFLDSLIALHRLFAAGAPAWLLPREEAGRRGRW